MGLGAHLVAEPLRAQPLRPAAVSGAPAQLVRAHARQVPRALLHQRGEQVGASRGALIALTSPGCGSGVRERTVRARTIDHGHSTFEMAGAFAATIHAKQLILTHFSPRYAGDASDASALSVVIDDSLGSNGTDASEAIAYMATSALGVARERTAWLLFFLFGLLLCASVGALRLGGAPRPPPRRAAAAARPSPSARRAQLPQRPRAASRRSPA